MVYTIKFTIQSVKKIMQEIEELLNIADRLLGPNGCPWDQKQTLHTLQPYLLEETHELIEAIDTQDPAKVLEELGDVLYALVFIAKLSEKNFTFTDAVKGVCEKLIRRHPHVFGNEKISSIDDVKSNWEKIKKQEGKKGPIDGIPPSLPALSRAQKIIHKLKPKNTDSSDLGQRLWDLVCEADAQGIDAESALRRTCQLYEEKHRR
jgi:MazG family protein